MALNCNIPSWFASGFPWKRPLVATTFWSMGSVTMMWGGWGTPQWIVWQAWKLSLPKNAVIEVPTSAERKKYLGWEACLLHNFWKETNDQLAICDEQRITTGALPPGVKGTDSWRKVDKNATVDGRFRLLREVVSFRRCEGCEWIPLKRACGGGGHFENTLQFWLD